MNGLDWQLLNLPLAAGLMQRSDDRARSAPYLDRAVDVAFDEAGGIQTRKPFGTEFGALTNTRRIEPNGDELLVFTKDTLYSWSSATSEMISRGTHLAVAVDEETVFADTRDAAGGDRAELDGVVVFVYDLVTAGTPTSFVSVRSADTGTVIVAAHELANGRRPRVVALGTSILLFWQDSDAQRFYALALDPADAATSLQATPTQVLSSAPGTIYYDVERVPSTDTAVVALSLSANTTQYHIHTVSAAAALVTSSTKTRTTYGPLAVACTPDGAKVLVVRADNSAGDHDVLGDIITISGLVDTAHISKAIGTTPAAAGTIPEQITAAFRSTLDGGEYSAHVFWHYYMETTAAVLGAWSTKKNTLNTAGTLGTAAVFMNRLALCSRAFEHENSVFVHLAYAEPAGVRSPNLPGQYRGGPALQNTAFLYRDDGHRAAKVAPGKIGGYIPRRGILPGVALIEADKFAWCATERRIVPTEHDQAYTDRGPRDVVITFDDDRARRCVRLGETLYITGGELLAYDGVELVEVGWPIMPSDMTFSQSFAGGDIGNGTYAYRPSWAHRNAKGEIDRSSTAVVGEFTLGGGPSRTLIDVGVLTATRKSRVAVEVWRTEAAPTFDAPFFLITSPDPGDEAETLNSYEVNNAAASWSGIAMIDALADADITDLPAHPTAGTEAIEYIAPPAGTILLGGEARLILAGVAGDRDRVYYSRQRKIDEVASFHGALVTDVPAAGGGITALAFLLETLIVFRESAVYAFAGDGLDNTLGGRNFGPARQLASDVGAVNHESVCALPQGLLFKSSKGWYLLNRGWMVEYVGAAVKDYDSETPLAVTLLENVHEVRILTASRMLVWDYAAQQWGERSISDGVHACMWGGTYYYLTATGARAEVAHGTTTGFGLDVETGWIKPADLQGFSRVRKLQILGEYRSSDVNVIRIRIKYNYDDATYVDDKYWDVSPTTVGGPLQVKIGPSRQQIQSIKIRITPMVRSEAVPEIGDPIITYGSPTGEAIKLTGLAIEVGLKRGAYPRLPAAQRS